MAKPPPKAPRAPGLSQSVAKPATEGGGGEASQLSQSQPDEFPIAALPDRVFEFVCEVAAAHGVDWALVAGACLAALAGCIGNRRRIVLKSSWREPAILWVVIVMRSGGGKTPAIDAVLAHLHKREAAEIEEERARQADYDRVLQKWQSTSKNERGEPPEKPEPARRLLVSDATTEGLLSVHARAPLGLLLHRDELAAWLRSFNQYKARGVGSDAQAWNELHQGNQALIDRKGSPTLSVRRAAVSIIGGIQPALLRSELGGEHMYDGMAARILFVVPEEQVKKWTETTISDEASDGWTQLLEDILALEPDQDGNPIDLEMSEAAKAVWVKYYDAHNKRQAQEDGPMRAAMAKLEGMTARLALVLQLADDPKSTEIGVEAMRNAIKLSEWFEGQARLVYSGFGETEQERDRREACKWIAKKVGGSITQRDFARLGPYRFRKVAGKVLDDLVEAGLAKLSPPSGGHGAEYVLCDSDSCDTEEETGE